MAQSALTSVDREFPGALDVRRFVFRTQELLSPFGFTMDNTIACVGCCRDELTRPLSEGLIRAWGEAFNFSSLGGQLTLGETGFGAARSHSPLSGGRERFLFVTMPHIGIDHFGNFGQNRRPGQNLETPTCGALSKLAADLRNGALDPNIDPADIEYSYLRRRLGPVLAEASDTDGHDLVPITRIARQEFLIDLEALIGRADMTNVDYAIFSGIQIHTANRDYVWVPEAYAVVDDQRRDLLLSSD